LNIRQNDSKKDRRCRLAVKEGLYYGTTGLWPLLHLPSFLWVTGPKRDLWLVRTVGALVAVSGVTLLAAGRRGRVTPEIALLGAGQSAAFFLIDTVYALRGRIAKIYLADAVLQLGLLAAWGLAGRGQPPEGKN
jgi:hypothetical protein